MTCRSGRLVRVTFIALLLMLGCVSLARAYAEEPLRFRLPGSTVTTDEEVSSIHDDLTYALALAAGFSQSDSRTLEIWNQLVDSEVLGAGSPITYTNCVGAFCPTPDPSALCPGSDTTQVAWPQWAQMEHGTETCFTSRFGPYSPFFHFPHQNALELGALHDWGWGTAQELIGYEAYAWGAKTVVDATCRYTHTVVITTGLEAGSLEAFATYLHSLADSYSHRECIAEMDAAGVPWGTHVANPSSKCYYIPAHPTNRDAHGKEFGTASLADSQRTDEALLAIYAELSARSLAREGLSSPLGLDEPLAGLNGTALRGALYRFVHDWTFDQATSRRDYADSLVAAIRSQSRQAIRRLYLPVASVRETGF